MAESLENSKATTESPPPPYQEPGQSQQQPGPATSGKWYQKDAQHPTMKFVYCPDPSRDFNTQDWAALLLVKCSDVPRLMREGFYLDSSNIIREDGYIDPMPNITKGIFQRKGKKWDCVRYYFLKDQRKPQRWIATVQVYALHIETLRRFNLNQLSPANVRLGMAFSQLGHQIYEYCYGKPKYYFNAIYDDMPMEGQWPWPRKEAEGKDGKLANEKAVATAKKKP